MDKDSPSDIKELIYTHRLISVIRGDFSLEEVLAISEALTKGGIRILEITLNTPSALEAINALKKQADASLIIGAGTVRTATDVQNAVDAGASFCIAPCFDLPSVEAAQAHRVLHIPGIFTATEAQAAYRAGCKTVKLFPAEALGPKYIKTLRAPLDHIDFIPSGGVDVSTLAAFHDAGAVAFSVGSALVKNIKVTELELSQLTQRAQALYHALKNIHPYANV